MTPLTPAQQVLLSTLTRLASALSILGSVFILGTFLRSASFRKPVTRLIFYATWGNLATNGATLISVSAMGDVGGSGSGSGSRSGSGGVGALCKSQAFLLQWFMLADPFWVFCMALNVWLVFRRGSSSRGLQKLEPWYFALAYGIPCVVAMSYLVHDYHSTRQILGPAILWCWVGSDFEWMRIVFYYAPVWVLAGATISVYVVVGVDMYRQQATLRAFRRRARCVSAAASPGGGNGDPIFVSSKDRIVVTTEIEHNGREGHVKPRSAIEMRSLTRSSSPRKPTALHMTDACSPSRLGGRHKLLAPLNPNSPRRSKAPLLISHRATAYAAPLASGDFATLPSPRVPVFQPAEHAAYTQRRAQNAAAYGYFRVAVLLFAALLVVWVPSSINRLHQLVRPSQPSFALNLVAAMVLPLQGLGNAAVYASTTWSDCKRVCAWLACREAAGDAVRGEEDVVYHGQTKRSARDKSVLQTV